MDGQRIAAIRTAACCVGAGSPGVASRISCGANAMPASAQSVVAPPKMRITPPATRAESSAQLLSTGMKTTGSVPIRTVTMYCGSVFAATKASTAAPAPKSRAMSIWITKFAACSAAANSVTITVGRSSGADPSAVTWLKGAPRSWRRPMTPRAAAPRCHERRRPDRRALRIRAPRTSSPKPYTKADS